MTVHISGTFSKESKEYNGLEAIAADLVKEPLVRRYVVGLIEVTDINIDVQAGGTHHPRVRFARLEAVDADDVATAVAMLDGRYATRTGDDSGVQDTLFDRVPDGAGMASYPKRRDPTAGPWPGDADYQNAEDDETR